MATQTSIVNWALQLIGAPAVTSIDDAQASALECKRAWTISLETTLTMADWSFAMARASLPREAAAPAFGYAYGYALPSEAFPGGVREVDTGGLPWLSEGGRILTDAETVQARYLRSVEVGVLPSSVQYLLAAVLARQVCEAVTGSGSLTESLDRTIRNAFQAAVTSEVRGRLRDDGEFTWLKAR